MSTSKHTPGPWVVDSRASQYVRNEAGRGIAACGGYYNNQIDPDALHAESYANARLIAAAPDMLAALERCDPGLQYELEDDMPDAGIFCELTVADIRAIRAAIRKAKEEQA